MTCISVGVGECQSEDPLVCFGAKPKVRFPARPEEEEEGKVQGQSTEVWGRRRLEKGGC